MEIVHSLLSFGIALPQPEGSKSINISSSGVCVCSHLRPGPGLMGRTEVVLHIISISEAEVVDDTEAGHLSHLPWLWPADDEGEVFKGSSRFVVFASLAVPKIAAENLWQPEVNNKYCSRGNFPAVKRFTFNDAHLHLNLELGVWLLIATRWRARRRNGGWFTLNMLLGKRNDQSDGFRLIEMNSPTLEKCARSLHFKFASGNRNGTN